MIARLLSPSSATSPALAAVLGALALSACATPEDTTPIAPTDAGTLPPATMDASTRECAIYDEGTTRTCSCAGGASGTQPCLGGVYQPCRCSVPLPEAGTTGGNLCRAGFYSGEFSGKYKPGAFGFGIFGSPVEFDIAGKGANGYPALSFTLEANEEGAGEFRTVSVKNGCMIGSAEVLMTDNPFYGRINGELNCTTGVFTGTIAGGYNMLNLGLKFTFAGTATEGLYSAAQSRIEGGVWNVKEPPALDGTPAGGGGGTWSAIWQSDTPPSGEDPCANAELASAPAPDAAVPGGSSDAGN